jgi:glutathione-independent formaldehyde dehydrogenase
MSHRIAVEEAPAAYDKFDKRIDGYTKILIKFGDMTKAA